MVYLSHNLLLVCPLPSDQGPIALPLQDRWSSRGLGLLTSKSRSAQVRPTSRGRRAKSAGAVQA
eukprot:4013026-Amphidinium_carterae.2